MTHKYEAVICPYCGRTVDVYSPPGYGRVMFGHRVTLPVRPGMTDSELPPWCEGGGRPV